MRTLSATLIALAVASLSACTADVPSLAQDGAVDNECTPFADLLVSFTPAGATGSSVDGERTLGAPDGSSILLDDTATLVVGFTGLGGIEDTEGDDLLVHGGTDEGSLLTVYVGDDPGGPFRFVAEFNHSAGATSFSVDISNSSVSLVRYIRVVGQGGNPVIDAFESTSSDCSTP